VRIGKRKAETIARTVKKKPEFWEKVREAKSKGEELRGGLIFCRTVGIILIKVRVRLTSINNMYIIAEIELKLCFLS